MIKRKVQGNANHKLGIWKFDGEALSDIKMHDEGYLPYSTCI